MAKESRKRLKTYFQTGDQPTESEFVNWFDSSLILSGSNGITGSVIISGSTNDNADGSKVMLYVMGDITSSGNISASGTIYADNFQSTGADVNGINFTDNVLITGDITASGDIHLADNKSITWADIGDSTNRVYIRGDEDADTIQSTVDNSNNHKTVLSTNGFSIGNITAVNTKEKLHVSGNILVSGSGHITASGNISASGKLYGTDVVGDKWKIDHDGNNLFISSSGNEYLQANNVEITSEAVQTNPPSKLTVVGDMTVKHITASYNISASGTLYGNEAYITGHITASNNISSSGNILGYQYKIAGGAFGTYLPLVDTIRLADTSKPTIIDGSTITFYDAPTKIVGHLTASGHISGGLDKFVKAGTGSFGRLEGLSPITVGDPMIFLSGSTFEGAVTMSGDISSSAASTGSFGRVDVDGDLFVSRYITHTGDKDTKITFDDNKLQLHAGNLPFITLDKDASSPYPLTINNGGNKINFRVQDNNSDLLLKTEAEDGWAGLYFKGNQKLVTKTDGINVTGDITASGDIITKGNLIAQQYIVSSSVTHLTQSFSSGSTIFGDTGDDTHQFTGSVSITGSITASHNISASGGISSSNVSIDESIYHNGDNDTFIKFTTDHIAIKAADKSFIKIDGNSSQKELTINDGPHDIDFVVKGSTNNPLLKAIAGEGKIGTNGKGTPEADFHMGGDLKVDSHITASGNISSSGIVYTNQVNSGTETLVLDSDDLYNKGGSFRTDNNITASGDISASGDIISNNSVIDTRLTVGQSTLNGSYGLYNKGTSFFSSSAIFNDHITASGDISASGAIKALSADINGAVDIDGGDLTVGTGLQLTNGGIINFGTSLDNGRITWGTEYASLYGKSATTKLRLGSCNTEGVLTISSSHENTMVISGSNVGIGTTSPSSKLHVAGTTKIELPSTANHFKIEGDVDSKLFYAKNDKVGIGTQTPTAKLHISGNLYTSGSNGHITASGDISASGNIETNNIVTNAGNLDITVNTVDGDIQFKADNGSGTATTYFRADGSEVNTRFIKDLKLSDNTKALVGGSDDLQIYHNSTDSIIESKTGNLLISASANERIKFVGNITASGAISASGDVYSTNHESIWHSSINCLANNASNWFGPNKVGLNLNTWNFDYGNDTAVLTLAQEHAHAGVIVPYKSKLVGFRAIGHPLAASNHMRLALFHEPAASATFGDTSGAAVDATIESVAEATQTNTDTAENPMIFTQLNASKSLAAGDMLYPRLKITGTAGGNVTFTILVQREK